MLPDFLRVKAKRSRWFIRAFRRELERLTPMLSHAKTVCQHEGRKLQYDTVEGIRTHVDYENPITTPLEIDANDIPNLWPGRYLALAHEMAAEAARQQKRQFFSMMDSICKDAGTSINADGQPFSIEMLLTAWEKVDFDFDDRGRPHLPTIVLSPRLRPTVEAALAEADESPELRNRLGELMQRKWTAWCDREADRKLVE